MKRYHALYKGRVWQVETVYYHEDDNARIRIGRTNDDGTYEWELVFEAQLQIKGLGDPFENTQG
jgi:hypothetical protein